MKERQNLNLANIRISYLEWNCGQEPLLLLHGMADCALVWSSLGDYLGDRYHIVAPDLRGHGESTKPDDYSFPAIIQDLEALMDSLGWQQAHILGHSWSGKLVTIWAAQNPERFLSAILVDPFFIGKMPSWLKITFPLLYRVLPFLKIMQSFENYSAAESIGKTLKQYRGWTQLQQIAFQGAIVQLPDGTWTSRLTPVARERIFAEVMLVNGLTEAIDIPTLLVKPKQGLNRTAWQLKPYQKYLKNLQICDLEGNHWVFLVQTDLFNLQVEKFLTEVKSQARNNKIQ
jgi:pimeloyl-ACP methyl ester carboxylesterase